MVSVDKHILRTHALTCRQATLGNPPDTTQPPASRTPALGVCVRVFVCFYVCGCVFV